MKTKNNIFGKEILHAVMMIILMGWTNAAWAGSDPIVAKWDFANGKGTDFKLQKETGTLAAFEMSPTDATPIVLDIDASSSSGKFDYMTGNKCVQFNKGTIIHIPVVSTKDVVEIHIPKPNTSYPLDFLYIGGNPATGEINIYRAKAEDVEKGYVEINAVGSNASGAKTNTYIYYISVTQYPPVYEEKCLYSTDFQDWKKQNASNASSSVIVTKDITGGKTLDFELKEIKVDPTSWPKDKNGNDRFKDPATVGNLMGAKTGTTYIKTSPIADVTTISFVHAATSSKRGWGLKVKGDGDADWVTLSNQAANPASGQKVEVEVKRKNVQLWFYNIDSNNNAYMTSLEIYGNVEVKEDVNITYYDTDGTTVLDKETVSASEPLKFKEGVEAMVTVPSGQRFRGWFDGVGTTAEKVLEGSELSVDLNLFAKATDIESITDNSRYTYDMTKRYFYPEDHELITGIEGGAWHDAQHGWGFSKGGTIKLQVAKTAHIDLTLCNQSKDGTITVADGDGNTISSFSAKATTDATVQGIDYVGDTPTTLTINIPAGTYIHALDLFNYKPVYVKFNFTGLNIVGNTSISDILCDPQTGIAKMPDNQLFYREGWSFKGWTDGTSVYEADKEYVFTETVTLKPKMEANTIDLTDTNSPIKVVWPFDYREAPAFNLQKAQAPYTKSVTVEGEKHDVTLYMDATTGKVTNQDSDINSFAGLGGQFNDGVKFSLPAVYGMEITLHASNKVDSRFNYFTHFGTNDDDANITVSDENSYLLEVKDAVVSTDKKTITYTYKGDATKVTINVLKAGNTKDKWGFYKDITVTYPDLPSIICTNNITNPDEVKFPNEKAENAGKITVTLKNTETAETTPRSNIGKRYKEGDVVTVTVTEDYGYTYTETDANGTTIKEASFEYTVADGKNIITSNFERKSLHKLTVKSADITLGNVTLKPIYDNFYQETRNDDDKLLQVESWYEEGTEITTNAEASRNYMLGYWSDGTTNLSQTNPYVFKMGAADQTIYAHFTLGNIGSVVFKLPDGMDHAASEAYKGAYSITPNALTNVRSFAIPTNYTIYKNEDGNKGSTLQYWIEDGSDGTNHYEPGQLYSFKTPNEEITLVPVFVENKANSDNRLSPTTIRYDFAREIREYDDANKLQRRKVCAQEVNIGKNEKPFWTAKTYIEVMEGGEDKSHDHDAAIWCDTGKDGYIRNTDLDDWCAFGPGTTLWVPAGTGTKISMLTYGKITTTTFDGVVPTLDEERTQQEREKTDSKKMYVYTYTTTSSANRVAIRIGDDYSYYQWLELNIQAANLVSLHTSVDNNERGVVANTESASGTEIKPLEDGGHAFHQGDRVRLTINRKFGYQFDKIVDPAKTDKNGNPLAVLEMNDDGTVNMVGLNDVSTTTKVSKNADGTWGDKDNTVFVLREIDPTEKELADSLRTRYEVEFNITTHRNLEIHFKAKDTYYITYNAGDFATGTPPEVAWVEAGDKYTIPRNQTLYYEGNTLKYWYDENDNRFAIGSTYTAEAKDVRMFPKFEPNDFNILDINSDATAIWNFTKNNGAPTIAYQKTKGILVTQLENDGKSIDMKIDLDATNGKFNNVDGDRPERIQINGGSVIGFTATPHCVATLETVSENGKKIEIEGKQLTTANSIAQTECTADESNLKVKFIDGPYCRLFSVTYKPQTAKKPEITTLSCGNTTYTADEIKAQIQKDGHITFTVSPWMNADESIPEVTGTATENGTVTATTATILTKACVATVKTKSGITVETIPIEFIFAEPTDYPQFVKAEVNGTEYTSPSSELYDVPQSGMVKIVFNRMMNKATISDDRTDYDAKAGKELVFKYWDQPLGSTLTYEVKPGDGKFVDIYGKECQQTLTLILHITDKADNYKHEKFDFIVGKDGTMDEAIAAANSNTKDDGKRYYIFVPDGEYLLSGNTTISCATEGDAVPKDEKGKPRPEMNGKNNGMTEITKPNVSVIGQSKDGTLVYNHPVVEGISYTATLRTASGATDFYAEDLTLENKFDYFGSMSGQSSGGAGRAAAFQDKGKRSIMKNVALKSYQDTYYSNNVSTDYRGYFENCDLYGVVDWLCGDGDILFEKCNIIVRDRSGNNIAAPSTDANQEWGYVFSNCNIMPELENPTLLKGNDWTLARPWGSSDDKIPASPACTFLNTRMYTLPRNYGWNKMGEGLVLRFHEYYSMNGAGNLLSLNTRSLSACSPAPGSDDCVLSDALAAKYTTRNIMGGPDAFEPNERCKQIDAKSGAEADMDENHEVWDDQIELDDDDLIWQAQPSALCYFVFKLNENTGKWIYKENTTDTSVNITGYGSGYYCVRAANQMGGLGAATEKILFELQDPYELEIKQTGDLTIDGEPYGWSTICLPFNAKVPQGVTVYAATAHDKTTDDEKVTDLTMTLTPVTIIDKEKGYVVYGPAGIHPFTPTSRSCTSPTILTGNPTKNDISATNINCYVLANKTWGLGFYKFTGTMLKAYRAWLPQDMVSTNGQSALATGTKAIRFTFANDTSIPSYPIHGDEDSDEEIDKPIKDTLYTTTGQRIESANQQGIYISKRNGKFAKK